jgi:hypothetical protein
MPRQLSAETDVFVLTYPPPDENNLTVLRANSLKGEDAKLPV